MSRPPFSGTVLKRMARDRLAEDLARCAGHFGKPMPMPELKFDLRGLRAGTAEFERWRIRLNPELLLHHAQSFIDDTVPHEAAHLVAWRVWGVRIQPHGTQWRRVMSLLGAAPERCHRYAATPSRRLRRFRYACSCREHWLSSIRHNRARRGIHYLCLSCREPVRCDDSQERA